MEINFKKKNRANQFLVSTAADLIFHIDCYCLHANISS